MYDEVRKMNRLQSEKSPYLLMHASNPVDWYPWGPEAFTAARSQDKPVFLSIGYSACHWCHVIAHESFENKEIASLLNDHFISIKVDKEERPDIDAVYMDAVQLTTGSGGWPMTLLLTPSGEPFVALTYLPKESQGPIMGLKDLLERVAVLWRQDRAPLLSAAHELTTKMQELCRLQPEAAEPSKGLLCRAVSEFDAAYDIRWGGFGSAPKFPSPHNLLFLLRMFEYSGDDRALAMATGTLDAMYRGGLFDHIGGGFCRYSVDERWLVPHFEKMLYDNALLLWAYAEAARLTDQPLYARIARRTAEYVLREMTGADGEFFSAQDADSEGREGAYYLFTPDEIQAELGRDDANAFCRWYDITANGNFEGFSIPNLIGNAQFSSEPVAIQSMRERIYAYRRNRMPLLRDDKVLTSWNSLMITSLCFASRALHEPAYLVAAQRAESFLFCNLSDHQGSLWIRYRDGEAKGDGILSDYAGYALALLALYDATLEKKYLERAEQIASRITSCFGDGQQDGFFLYSAHGERLVTRPKELWDGAVPSGNAAACLALLRLASRTGRRRWHQAADKQLRFMTGAAQASPTGYGFSLYAMAEALDS